MQECYCSLEARFQREICLGKRTESIFNQTFQEDHEEQNHILVIIAEN